MRLALSSLERIFPVRISVRASEPFFLTYSALSCKHDLATEIHYVCNRQLSLSLVQDNLLSSATMCVCGYPMLYLAGWRDQGSQVKTGHRVTPIDSPVYASGRFQALDDASIVFELRLLT